MDNPLLQNWDTPYGTPPFNLIETRHFRPAVEAAIKSAAEEVDSITSDPLTPDFDNTIYALDKAGDRLDVITAMLFNLNSAETSKDLQAASPPMRPSSSTAARRTLGSAW